MPKKILLADDSITIQKVVELTFSDGDYEVTAVNNGAKAVQKLAEMRPDIILSDIIMPEKNGYEVCEYVKSHPDYRNIPVVLLTGTFEPFDPDRAEKAGCDAVVTKPFESQSLIHKVEELIASAQSAAAAPAPEPAPTASPWMDDTGEPAQPSAFTSAAPEPYTHDADIFGAAPAPAPSADLPFEAPAESPFGAPPAEEAFSGETRAFPRMSFEELQQASAPTPAPESPAPAPEPSPWDEAPSPFAEPSADYSGETRAFTKVSFDDFTPPAPEPEAAAPTPEPESPFGAPPAEEAFSGETRAFPRMSFEELQQLSSPAPAPEPERAPEPAAAAPEPSPWDEPETPAFGGETRAFPKLSFDDLQQMSASTPPPVPEPEVSPWGEPSEPEAPAFGGETRAFPKLSFDDFQTQEPAPEPTPEPEPPLWNESAAYEPAAPVAEPAWSPEPEPEPSYPEPSYEEPAATPFADTAAPATPEDLPFATDTTPEPEPTPEPAWAPVAAAEAQAEPEEPAVAPPVLAPETPALPISRGAELTDEQVDRIARRVVELMSDQVVRNIAWEVIPDLAEMVVKERIRQLEAEA